MLQEPSAAGATASSEEAEPRWVREGAALWLAEARLFVSTVIGFVRRPRAFATAWAAGRRRAMNPLAVVAVSWPLLLPLDYGLQRLLGWDRRPSVSLWVELARAARPYLFVVPMALLLHVIFRALGSRRHLTTTLGVLLYWMVLCTAAWVLGLAGNLLVPVGHRLPEVTSALSLIWGALGLAGAHRVRFWWCLAALLGSSALSIAAVNALLDWRHLS